ncbi:hypothetical protein EV286_107341 [Rhizobium sp. BK251]|nr:hypothetical protein EV286_107341 [Rhizobium sp. BK251]
MDRSRLIIRPQVGPYVDQTELDHQATLQELLRQESAEPYDRGERLRQDREARRARQHRLGFSWKEPSDGKD